MNIFMLAADMLHLYSLILLILKIKSTKNVLGISYKTQEIYLVVFLLRYWDIFLYWISLYNFTMKLVFIGATSYTIYLMRFKKPFCLSYDRVNDNINHYLIVYPMAGILALLIHTSFGVFEISWSYSIWLEAFAIYPQLHMIQKIKEVENITSNYMACLGLYRFFYILNWIYKYFQGIKICCTSVAGAVFQTILYADFLYYYIKSKGEKKMTIPV